MNLFAPSNPISKSRKVHHRIHQKSTKQIVEEIRSKISSGSLIVDLTDGSILSYLSSAANNDDSSGIVSGGSHGGYWLDLSTKIPQHKETDTQRISTDGNKSKNVVERDLYPLMELWLEKKGYKSKDISTLKAGGVWGNPDIIGLDRVEIFGAASLDLASCEVKLSEKGWEQVIFEAISHKRFSNRSWFCYRVNNFSQPMPKSMEYYAERYRVGVVHIVLTDDEFLLLKSKQKEPLDYIENVIERVPALYDAVPLREQRELIDRTGITLTVSF